MAPRVDPVTSDTELPARTGVVVVGGGIIGTSTAFFLARKWHFRCALREGSYRGRTVQPQLGLGAQGAARSTRNPVDRESLRLWEGMNETVGAETGFRRTGIVFAAESEEDVARYDWLDQCAALPDRRQADFGRGARSTNAWKRLRWKAALY